MLNEIQETLITHFKTLEEAYEFFADDEDTYEVELNS
jgi:hypothetical protein